MAEMDTGKVNVKTDEASQKLIAFSSDALNNAKEIHLEFDDHRYRGDILDWRLGEYVLFRVRHADDGLVRIPVDYDLCHLRAIPENGKPVIFRVKLLQKKIPHLLISFPMEPEVEVVRKQARRFMRVTTPVVLKRKENVMAAADRPGIGTILDISEKGVMLQTSLPLEKGDRVTIFINVSSGGKKKNLEMLCIVRRVDQEGKQFTCGLEFYKPSEQSLRAVADLLAGN